MVAKVYTFQIPDTDDVRDSYLRTLRAGLIRRGVANPNVTPGSDFYVRAQSIANEVSVIHANSVIKADQLMTDTATGEHLENIGAVHGLAKRAAVGGTGTIAFDATAASLVPTGAQLTDGQGLRYQVSVGGTYVDGDLIPIAAVDTGTLTNLAEGSSLKWQLAPPFSAPTALVGIGGLVNGADEEGEEAFRLRILARLQNPPASGNWQHTAEFAELSSASVQKAFVYPAAQGPATTHVAVTAAPTSTNKNRSVAGVTITGVVDPYVRGQLPEHVQLTLTTVENVSCDVAIGLSIPSPPAASPPGPGGGWKDGSPWPSVDGASYFKVAVTAVTTTSRFTCDARTSPQAGVSRISWLSPYDWKIYSAVVTTVHSFTPGTVDISIDTPFIGLTTGCLIWPQAEQQQAYVDALLAGFELMGPGEKTTNVTQLQRGYRHPTPGNSWPNSLGAHLLRGISDAGEEVYTSLFLYRTDGTTTVNGNAGLVSPGVPTVVTNAPKQFVPRHLAFYKI